MTLEQLEAARFEINLALFANAFSKWAIEQDLALLEEEILVAKIVNLCLTGE